MSIWTDAMSRADGIVDDILGDTVLYATDGSSFTEFQAFIIDVEDIGVVGGIDEMVIRKRLKISKDLVAEPKRAHRVKCEGRLSGVWQPAGKTPQAHGRYWLVDLQKA